MRLALRWFLGVTLTLGGWIVLTLLGASMAPGNGPALQWWLTVPALFAAFVGPIIAQRAWFAIVATTTSTEA